jgi:hypothetical protein
MVTRQSQAGSAFGVADGWPCAEHCSARPSTPKATPRRARRVTIKTKARANYWLRATVTIERAGRGTR